MTEEQKERTYAVVVYADVEDANGVKRHKEEVGRVPAGEGMVDRALELVDELGFTPAPHIELGDKVNIRVTAAKGSLADRFGIDVTQRSRNPRSVGELAVLWIEAVRAGNLHRMTLLEQEAAPYDLGTTRFTIEKGEPGVLIYGRNQSHHYDPGVFAPIDNVETALAISKQAPMATELRKDLDGYDMGGEWDLFDDHLDVLGFVRCERILGDPHHRQLRELLGDGGTIDGIPWEKRPKRWQQIGFSKRAAGRRSVKRYLKRLARANHEWLEERLAKFRDEEQTRREAAAKREAEKAEHQRTREAIENDLHFRGWRKPEEVGQLRAEAFEDGQKQGVAQARQDVEAQIEQHKRFDGQRWATRDQVDTHRAALFAIFEEAVKATENRKGGGSLAERWRREWREVVSDFS